MNENDFEPIENSPKRLKMMNNANNQDNNHESLVKASTSSASESVEMAELPEAQYIEQFLQNPSEFRPHPAFLTNVFLEDDTLLTHAVKVQNVIMVTALIKAGADPNTANKKGITPISAAAHKGNTAILKILVDAGADVNAVNASGSTALIQV
jgi:ankyrin repeat protein